MLEGRYSGHTQWQAYDHGPWDTEARITRARTVWATKQVSRKSEDN